MTDTTALEHPDVHWEEVDPQVLAKAGRSRPNEPDTGPDAQPEPSAAMPATIIDRTVGVCVCWLCRERPMPRYEGEWMFGVLAKYALSKPQPDRSIWVQDWTLRHGKFAGAVLARHMDRIISIEGRHRA